MWPGERQVYALSHASDATTLSAATNALTIIKTNRTTDVKNANVNPLLLLSRDTHYDTIIAQASTPTATVITREFDALGNWPQLCLYENFCNYISERYDTRFMWSKFCILRRNRSRSVGVFPYVVQAFNHFDLVYRGKLWQFDNFIDSTCAWFAIMESDHKFMLSPTLSIKDFAEEIFFQERVRECVEKRLRVAAGESQYVFEL